MIALTPLLNLAAANSLPFGVFYISLSIVLRPDPTSQAGDAAARDRWGVCYRSFVNSSQPKGEQFVKNDINYG